MHVRNALRRARAQKQPLCHTRQSSSGYTPKLGIRGKYLPGTTAPLRISKADLPAPGQLPQLGRTTTVNLPTSQEVRGQLPAASATDIEVAQELPQTITDAVTRVERSRAVREGVVEAYQRRASAPLVPLPHKDFVPPYLKEKQRWQRGAATFSWWTCGALFFWGILFSTIDKEESVLKPIRAWFEPIWERWWTLTPYDRLVLGLSADDTAERLELQSLRQMAYRPPQEDDAYWQTMRFANTMTHVGGQGKDWSRDMPPRPAGLERKGP